MLCCARVKLIAELGRQVEDPSMPLLLFEMSARWTTIVYSLYSLRYKTRLGAVD